MPKLTCEPDHLLTALTLAGLTAYKGKDDPVMSSLVAYTLDREHAGPVADGGASLVITSGNGAVAGICEIPVTGELTKPIVIPPYDIGWLSAMVKTAKGQADKETPMMIELEVSTDGRTLTARAVGDIPEPTDRRGVAGLGSIDDYPLRDVIEVATLPADAEASAVRTIVPPAYASIAAAAGKATKNPVSVSVAAGTASSAVLSGDPEAVPAWRIVLPSTIGVEPADVPDIAGPWN